MAVRLLTGLAEPAEALALLHRRLLASTQINPRRVKEIIPGCLGWRDDPRGPSGTMTTSRTSSEKATASDAAFVQDQIAVFKALGGGWQRSATRS